MSLIETYQSCKQLIAGNLTEKGIEADTTDGLTTLANKILDIEGTSTTQNIIVKAKFNDSNNQDGFRPISLIGKLYADGVAYKINSEQVQVTLNNDNSWTSTIEDLPINHEYTINFDPIREYTINTEALGNLIICTLTHEVETTSVSAQVIFDDNSDASGKRPGSVELVLFKNNKPYLTQIVNPENGWRYTFDDLPLNNNPTGTTNGQYVNTYTINTLSVPQQYKQIITGSARNGFNINLNIMEGSLKIRAQFDMDPEIDNENPLKNIGDTRFTIWGPGSDLPMTITYAQFTNGIYELDELVPGTYAVICNNAISLVENAMLDSNSVTAMAFDIEDNDSQTAHLFLHYVPIIPPEE